MSISEDVFQLCFLLLFCEILFGESVRLYSKMYSWFSYGSLFFLIFSLQVRLLPSSTLYYFTALQLVFLIHFSPHSFFLLSEAPFGNTVVTMLFALQHPEQLITDNNMVNTETACFPLTSICEFKLYQDLESILELCKIFGYHASAD